MSVLPVTGVATGAMVLAGLGLVVVGGIAMVAARLGARRRRRSHA